MWLDPLRGNTHGGFGERLEKRTRSNPDTALQDDSANLSLLGRFGARMEDIANTERVLRVVK